MIPVFCTRILSGKFVLKAEQTGCNDEIFRHHTSWDAPYAVGQYLSFRRFNRSSLSTLKRIFFLNVAGVQNCQQFGSGYSAVALLEKYDARYTRSCRVQFNGFSLCFRSANRRWSTTVHLWLWRFRLDTERCSRKRGRIPTVGRGNPPFKTDKISKDEWGHHDRETWITKSSGEVILCLADGVPWEAWSTNFWKFAAPDEETGQLIVADQGATIIVG